MNEVDVLLVYPQLGSWDNLLRDIPLSVIYAATDSVKKGHRVKILDCRLYPNTWREEIDRILKGGCSLVGLSVMTGHPITTSLEVSRYVKEKYGCPVVWGGPHPTILPEQTLENRYVDFVIRDWGSKPLSELVSHIKDKNSRFEDIVGLAFKRDGAIVMNPTTRQFEILDYRDIPYHLVEIDSHKYNRLNDNKIYFPIFTAIGCPYQCSFCMSPAVYGKIQGKKWIPFPVESVFNHIEYLLEKYRITNLQIYDDDSFVNIERMREFLSGYVARGFQKTLKLDFRGARINELDKMDDGFLDLMVKANIEMLAIGVESGSDEALRRMKKGITVEQILRVSKKLERFPSLKPHYNIFCGTPGETYEDLVKTKDLMVRLVEDNPSCMLGFACDWKPLPGSVMTEVAVREYKLKLPASLEEWARIDSFDAEKITHPWYTKKTNNYIKLLQIVGMILGQKFETVSKEMSSRQFFAFKTMGLLARAYRPFLKFRLRHNFSSFLVEYPIKTFMMKLASRF